MKEGGAWRETMQEREETAMGSPAEPPPGEARRHARTLSGPRKQSIRELVSSHLVAALDKKFTVGQEDPISLIQECVVWIGLRGGVRLTHAVGRPSAALTSNFTYLPI